MIFWCYLACNSANTTSPQSTEQYTLRIALDVLRSLVVVLPDRRFVLKILVVLGARAAKDTPSKKSHMRNSSFDMTHNLQLLASDMAATSRILGQAADHGTSYLLLWIFRAFLFLADFRWRRRQRRRHGCRAVAAQQLDGQVQCCIISTTQRVTRGWRG